jgi:hypothetical protein
MKTKIYLIALLFLASFNSIQALNNNESEDNLNISVVVPLQMEGLTSGQLSKIESKMLRMVSNYGIAGEGYTDKFIMYPKYEIYDHKIVEGLQNVHVIDVELNFIIKEVKTGKVYSVFNQEITGDGYSKKEAINQSISQIKTKGEKIKNFLQDAKTKILEYYRSNCNRLYDEADTMVEQKRYNEAIALLYPVPKEVGGDCYKKIQRKLDEAYNGYLNKTCEKNLVRAKAEISKNNNETALEILGAIETESNCHSSAQQLKVKIQTRTKNNGQNSGTSDSSTEPVESKEANDSVKTPNTNLVDDKKPTKTVNTSSPVSGNERETRRAKKRKKMGEIARTEFKRTRHQGEMDRAMQEG